MAPPGSAAPAHRHRLRRAARRHRRGAGRSPRRTPRTREQFGRPIGTFQAVSQRLADGYIDTLGQRLTLWQAAWRLGEGLPAEKELATATLFAADAGHRVAHTTVHVHGGVGIDLDGEAHRYFTAAKRLGVRATAAPRSRPSPSAGRWRPSRSEPWRGRDLADPGVGRRTGRASPVRTSETSLPGRPTHWIPPVRSTSTSTKHSGHCTPSCWTWPRSPRSSRRWPASLPPTVESEVSCGITTRTTATR